MEAYQERVISEMKDLSEKLTKLNTFIDGGGDTFAAINQKERERLIAQSHAMSLYFHILKQRIEAFG